jgi:ABC-type glycerol-3-phosphate transport system substrate-binding protein
MAATAARGGTAAGDSVSVLGPYGGTDQQSFQAVLAGFTSKDAGAKVTYTPAAGGQVDATLADLVKKGSTPDIVVLSLPDESGMFTKLATDGTLKPLGFAASAVDSNYAFTWKALGSVGGKLYGLPFKASDESAFWYDTGLFKRVGVTPPQTLQQFQTAIHHLLAAGIKPISLAGGDLRTMADLFWNVYLTQQGPARYDRLASHQMTWTDPSVAAAFKTLSGSVVNPGALAQGMSGTLTSDLSKAASQVFGAPPKAAAVFGGSSVLSVLRTAKAARLAVNFGTFGFPSVAKPPARIVGRADVAVMLNDTPAARAMIEYLATPEAATIWAKRGGFLSPNNKINLASYPVGANRTMAAQLTKATIFRLDASAEQTAAFRTALGQALQAYVKSPSRLSQILKQIEAAAAAKA